MGRTIMVKLHSNRRSLLKAAGVSVVGGAALAGAAGAAGPSLRAQVKRVERKTKKYEDPQVALDDGFVVLGPYVPGMGWHFLNPARVQAAVEDGLRIDEPQLLTYDDRGGDLTLGSVEYAIPVGARGYDEESPPDLFNDEGTDANEHWHVHEGAEHVFAVPPPPPEDEPELDEQLHTTRWVEIVSNDSTGEPLISPGDAIVTDFSGGGILDSRVVSSSNVHPDLWTLHAWVHIENPDGVFHATNKTLADAPLD